MKVVSQMLVVAVFALFVSSCNSSKSTESAKGADSTTENATAGANSVENTILEKYWKLIEINGNPVTASNDMGHEPHIILKKEDNFVQGNGGCNSIRGTYTLDEKLNRVSFSQMVGTMMACSNMAIESEMFKVLGAVDNYTLSADGNTLSLNKARMAPLARFEAVYTK